MSFVGSSKFTKYVISAGLFVAGLCFLSLPATALFEEIIRKAARDNGLVPTTQTHVPVNKALLAAGKQLFESKAMSLNGRIACQSCHLDEFGSADGIPTAVAIGGEGKGKARVTSGGAALARNTLPLWGRGGVGFSVFFWDGKVDFSADKPVSQFGGSLPSDDPLIVAVHLPPAEIREMLAEDDLVRSSKTEEVASAHKIYAAILAQLKEREPEALDGIAAALSTDRNNLKFEHVAKGLASFIRHEFRLQDTKFHRFVFGGEELSADELRGAQLFYGKGKCANCHSGPYFSDFRFHAVPLPQLGFGKNGFGIDYGRFNVSHKPRDLYKFRTPPLYNAEKTAPYGHSGAVATLKDAIISHFDPLREIDPSSMSALDRHEYFKRMGAAAESVIQSGYLEDNEVDALVAFLKTLSY